MTNQDVTDKDKIVLKTIILYKTFQSCMINKIGIYQKIKSYMKITESKIKLVTLLYLKLESKT